jgi:hypothetical protein
LLKLVNARPGRRTSKLEFVVALTLVALFAGWWAARFSAAQADMRILRVREVATTMRMLSREIHLQAVVANQADITGTMRTAYGPVQVLDGHPTPTAGGIGRLLAQHIPARSMSCGPMQMAHPAGGDQLIDAFECAPSELEPGARERCAARYLPPLWQGGEPTVTFLFHSRRAAGLPCEPD